MSIIIHAALPWYAFRSAFYECQRSPIKEKASVVDTLQQVVQWNKQGVILLPKLLAAENNTTSNANPSKAIGYTLNSLVVVSVICYKVNSILCCSRVNKQATTVWFHSLISVSSMFPWVKVVSVTCESLNTDKCKIQELLHDFCSLKCITEGLKPGCFVGRWKRDSPKP